MKGLTLTVTQLNEYVRKSLAADPMLRGLCLCGELSNLKRHVSGHWYFTLKDEDAAINCAMFRSAVATVRFQPCNGQQVRLYGSVGLYTKTGSYQFYADGMESEGIGELYLRFEKLKEKLASEGLFDAALKKPLPLLPRGIGIITSQTGAVVHDIARVSWRRDPGMPLYLCPVKVQGDGAAREIVNALRLLDAYPEVDVIIVGRGGGSMEDLWAFNEEPLARAIVACRTPVVSAVGHETDFTIADFVADLRAPTPSAAAELVVPERAALREGVNLLETRIGRAMESGLQRKRAQLGELNERLSARSPAQRGERMLARLNAAAQRMETCLAARLTRERHLLAQGEFRLLAACRRIDACALSGLAAREQALERAVLHLRTAGPMETIRRGYAIVTRNGKPMRLAAEAAPKDKLSVRLFDGSIEAEVLSVTREEQPWLQRP
ncbi:MAG: exodeoxyribonuclease VII large subunit [Clostridia bacterium]